MSRVLDAIRRHAADTPAAPALIGPAGTITYAELPGRIGRASAALTERLQGLPPHAPVALALDDTPAWALIDLALLSLGRPCLPLPPFFTAAQRDHAIADAGAVLLVAEAGGGAAPPWILAGRPLQSTTTGAAQRTLPAGTAKITYTSGSTGTPKGVCLSLDQMERVAQSLVDVLGTGPAGVHLSLLPLGVLLENVGGLYATLIAGGAHHAPGAAATGLADAFRPDLAAMVQAIVSSRATTLILVPELLRGLMAVMARTGLRLPDLRFVAVGGAKVSPALLHAAAALGVPVFEGYGLTECASVVALNTPEAHEPGAAGRILPHLDVHLEPDGEIVVGPSPFLGYVGEPARSGPVRTGDIGEWSEHGALRIVGRRKNLIISSFGRNISPEWVESELLAEPGIAQAVVFGEGSGTLSAVLVGSSAAAGLAGLTEGVARANDRLPPYARIGRWLPAAPFTAADGHLTGNGRPRRAALAATYGDFLKCDSEA